MSSSNDVRYFNGTCEEFELASCTGAVLNSRFLDPCSCSRFYRCTQTYEIISESCGEDTLWDADLGQCNHAHEVRIKQECEPNNSWLRCNTTEERLLQLEHICTKTPTTTVLPTTGSTIETTTAPPSGSSDTNIGLIVGLSITSVVVIVLIVLFILYRRKHSIGIKKKRGTIAHNPEYFESGNHDDPYAVIDERLTSPVYSTQTQGRTNGGFSNTGYSMSRTEEATYDNSVARAPEPGYTSTLNRSFREYGTVATNRTPQQTTSDVTTTVNQTDDVVNGVQTKRSTLLDENGNRSSSESSNNSAQSNTNGVETLKDQTLSDLARANVSETDADDPATHDYLVLHPNNDHL